jgi:SlyX protein
MTQTVDERMEALETKISYQEHMIQELNEVVISQQNQVDKLEKSLQVLQDQLQHREAGQSPPEQEAPPPHY